MTPLGLVGLTPLIDRTSGRSDVTIGLIDGPVVMNHPDLTGRSIREISGNGRGTCTQADSMACLHGTFVAGILSARRESAAPAICPDCTLLVRPIFTEVKPAGTGIPNATPEELAQAILDCIREGAHLLNISAAIAQPSSRSERALEEALNQAARLGVVIVAAAGNQGILGSTAITRHRWVIPVVGYDLQGRPIGHSNLGNSIGRRGLGAPGDKITSLGAEGEPLTLGGTSAAAPFVTGTIALLWSEFPDTNALELKIALTQANPGRRASVVPPLLDSWGAYQYMLTKHARKNGHEKQRRR